MLIVTRALVIALSLILLEGASPALSQTSGQLNDLTAKEKLGAALRKVLAANNTEEKIAAIDAALLLFSMQSDSRAGQDNIGKGLLLFQLGEAWADRQEGARFNNLERAIAAYDAALTLFSREANPALWAQAQHNLGTVYIDRMLGDRADNIERAIAAYYAALNVATSAFSLEDRAIVQVSLANAYRIRMRGNNDANVEDAIAASETALTVLSREASPEPWAVGQANLGAAYLERSHGDHADNMERAITAFESAATIYTRDFPGPWAKLQNNLGNAYLKRVRGDRADNIERAIAAYDASLKIPAREVIPSERAMFQTNLGNAYRLRILGEPADNIERAIAAHEAALAISNRQKIPEDWAQIQNNLGAAYENRLVGARDENMKRAATAYENALTVYVREAHPREHVGAAANLGRIRMKQADWKEARQVFANVIATTKSMLGDGLDDNSGNDFVARSGILFANAAYIEAQSGNGRGALDILEDGRARMLRAAFRLDALKLSEAERQRVVSLRGIIRGLENRLGQPNLPDRRAVLAEIAEHRRQIGQLVQLPPEKPLSTLLPSLVPHRAAAIVAPVVTDLGGALIVIAGDKATVTIHPLPDLTTTHLNELLLGPNDKIGPGGWMDGYLEAFYSRLSATDQDVRWRRQVAVSADVLWQRLGRHVDDALRQRGVAKGARVVWLPSGRTGVIPIGLAREAKSGQYLIDRYEFATIPSLRALGRSDAAVQPTLGAVINPTGDLPFTPVEGALVAGRFTPMARIVMEQQTATAADGVLAALAGRSYWHLSGHGNFDWLKPEASGFSLAGGANLSVERLLARLGNDDGTPPRLVVLSACETGLAGMRAGQQDEFLGLPMALLAGGARAVLATQWPVDDLATMFLVSRFYDLHLGPDHLPPPTALREAQVWLREATGAHLRGYIQQALDEKRLDPTNAALVRDAGLAGYADYVRPFADPVYWAGFSITGM